MKAKYFSTCRGSSRPWRTICLQQAAATILLFFSAFFIGRIHAQTPGSLDTSFGGAGSVSAVIGQAGLYDFTISLTLQPDGKILVGGGRERAADDEFVLVRYHANGTIDTSFGGGDGIATTSGGTGAEYPGIYGIAVLQDGSIVGAGDGFVGQGVSADYDHYLLRYNATGAVDVTFGGGDGMLVNDPSVGLDDYLVDMLLQPDGKIVAAGSVVEGGLRKPAVMRYLANGAPDTSFSGDGILAFNPTAFGGDAFDVAMQSDGKILITGSAVAISSVSFDQTDVMVARCNANGTPDTTFGGGDGIVLLRPDPSAAFLLGDGSQILALSDGKILVAGSCVRGSGTETEDSFLARYLSTGVPDTSFGGGDGLVFLPSARTDTDESNPRFAVLADGDLVVASGLAYPFDGITQTQKAEFMLIKVNPDGSLDSGFGAPNGWVVRNPATGAGESFVFSDLILQPDGRVVVCGNRQTGAGDSLGQIVARYHMGTAAAPDPLEAWRQLHFGTTANTGDAANDADPNGNGVVNLVEFAMGTPPKTPGTGGVPLPVVSGPNLQFTFSRSKSAAPKVSLILEWSDSLAAGTWSTTGVVEQMTGPVGDIETILATLPAGSSGRRYARFRTMVK